nr:hypothetical protein CFP56_11533 [Quercus suber]
MANFYFTGLDVHHGRSQRQGLKCEVSLLMGDGLGPRGSYPVLKHRIETFGSGTCDAPPPGDTGNRVMIAVQYGLSTCTVAMTFSLLRSSRVWCLLTFGKSGLKREQRTLLRP